MVSVLVSLAITVLTRSNSSGTWSIRKVDRCIQSRPVNKFTEGSLLHKHNAFQK
jgi:hypothetical protein